MSWSRQLALILSLIAGLLLLLVPVSAKDTRTLPATHPTLVNSQLPPLIELETFFSTRTESWGHRVSPDGSKLLWIALHDDKPTVHFRKISSQDVKVIKGERAVRWAYWAADSRHITGWWDNDGDENYHFLLADSENPEKPFKNTTPFDGVKIRFQQWFPDRPLEYLLSDNRRNRALFDLFWHNIATGEERLLMENPGDISYYVTDKAGDIFAIARRLNDEEVAIELADDNGDWRTLLIGGIEDHFHILGPPPVDTDWVWAISNIGRDKQVLVKYYLKTGNETVIHEDPQADVTHVSIDEETYELQAAWSAPGYNRIRFFNPDLKAVYEKYVGEEPVNFRVRSRSLDFSVMILGLNSDTSPGTSYLLDRKTDTRVHLASPAVAKHSEILSTTKPVSFVARDGMTIHGYLTIPKGTLGKNLPMVLAVHGGPFARDWWGYRDYDQFLANRGYAVLRVNYRGSTGYGRAYIAASERQIGRAMHTDLIDGVEWAIEQGVADPEKIAIYGRSYGGYSALAGLTFTPDVFAAGINIVGVADLELAYKTFPAYWKNWLNRWYKYIGHPDNPEDMAELRRYSPIHHVEKISKPLLVAQGANDVRVVREHSDLIVKAAKQNGVDVKYIVYDDEGHAIRRWKNRMDLAREIENFLAKHIGGRAESPVE
ncbi:MAG: S9 family peptidase [Pseudomonadota bacterium]